jgi:hypothetical protein
LLNQQARSSCRPIVLAEPRPRTEEEMPRFFSFYASMIDMTSDFASGRLIRSSAIRTERS